MVCVRGGGDRGCVERGGWMVGRRGVEEEGKG